MSTFNGVIKEFPDIRIDYFRSDPDPAARPPLAYFLSHVHSDHLVGLESCKSPFIYCSPATRDILLRLEKYPHRMNFAKGILETRKQTYRHLKKLLKAIPLDMPTTVELSPGREIRVTLLDANHCVGAVMFLIEDDYKNVLYTGDIRSERWWVDALKRNPVLLQYLPSSAGGFQHKELDCIYLDTTFVVSGDEERFRKFPSKADGIQELIQRVSQYPKNTVFYIYAWTFGYEDVWQALSVFLGSQIHVDEYRYGLYRALINGIEPKAPEAVQLMGFPCGNHFQQGCLSSTQCRLHSCEKGSGCKIWDQDFVRITPIISRHNGVEMAELGTGGGQGDLSVQHELEVYDPSVLTQLMALCASKLQGQPELLNDVVEVLTPALKGDVASLGLEDFNLLFATDESRSGDEIGDMDEVSLDKMIPALANLAEKAKKASSDQSMNEERIYNIAQITSRLVDRVSNPLPKQITFPYSRHSSYEELCMLVEAFQPLDVHPCTVDEAHWSTACSMRSLFGHVYSDPPIFSHDESMKTKRRRMPIEEDFIRPTSLSCSLTNTNGADMIQGPCDEIRPRRKTHARNEGFAELNQILDRRPGSIPTDRRNQELASDVSPALHRECFSSLSPVKSTSVTPLNQVLSRPIRDETAESRKRTTHTTTRLDLSSPTPRVRKEPKRLASPKIIEDIPLASVVPESDPPTPGPRKRFKPDNRAFRNEVYDSIHENNGLSWADIGLVSVKGHQEREVEL